MDYRKNGGALVDKTRVGKFEILNLSFYIDGACRREYYYLDIPRAKIMRSCMARSSVSIQIREKVTEYERKN